MVTHSSTSRPVQCLCMAERTGCPVLTDLWSYVSVHLIYYLYSFASNICRELTRYWAFSKTSEDLRIQAAGLDWTGLLQAPKLHISLPSDISTPLVVIGPRYLMALPIQPSVKSNARTAAHTPNKATAHVSVDHPALPWISPP
jgi:hypothetical protein